MLVLGRTPVQIVEFRNWHGPAEPIDSGPIRRTLVAFNQATFRPTCQRPPIMSAQSRSIDAPKPPVRSVDMIKDRSGIDRQSEMGPETTAGPATEIASQWWLGNPPVSRCPRFLLRLRSGATFRSREPGIAQQVSQDGARRMLQSRPPPSATAIWNPPSGPQPRC